MTPLANSYIRPEAVRSPEVFYPLKAFVCSRCFLVQLEQFESPERIFGDYAYFSSYSSTWLEHSERFAVDSIQRFGLHGRSLVVELASNDGYLLQFFASRGIPVLGVEPARNVADVALGRGIPTRTDFFGTTLAAELAEGQLPDLIVANNVLAHVPELNDFVAGLKILLDPRGVITIEVPHLLRLIEDRQFDTIYHEHFSYFSFTTLETLFASQGLKIEDVEEIPTHGGSLRLYVRHEGRASSETSGSRVEDLLEREKLAGISDLATYESFCHLVSEEKRSILSFLLSLKEDGYRVAGYGAPAKGNTLLNFCGIGPDMVEFTVDQNPAKQGLYLPGSRIPIFHPQMLDDQRPDVVWILPWNIREEVVSQMQHARGWGVRFAARTPQMKLLS